MRRLEAAIDRSERAGAVHSTVGSELARAIAHPIRTAILEQLTRLDMASASELAALLGMRPNVVSYHVRQLERSGFLELVGKVQRRGAMVHYFRARSDQGRSDAEPEAMRSWSDLANGRQPLRAVLDPVAMKDLRTLIRALAVRMRQLELATTERRTEGDADASFIVELRFQAEPVGLTRRGSRRHNLADP